LLGFVCQWNRLITEYLRTWIYYCKRAYLCE